MSPEEELIRAGEAKQILDSRMFKDARKDLDQQLAALRRKVPIADDKMHTRIILLEQMYGYLMDYFEQIAMTGKMAEIQLEEKRRQASLVEQGIAMFRRMGRNA